MSRCERWRELFSAHLEGELDATDRRRVRGHLGRCDACARVHRELEALLADLPELEPAVPVDLGRTIAARVPLHPRPEADAEPAPLALAVGGGSSHGARRAAPRAPRPSLVAWRRAAAWAFVFLGAWWQLAGGAVASFAATEIVPKASSAVADVRESAARRSAAGEGLFGRLNQLGRVSEDLSRATSSPLFGESPLAAGTADPAASARPGADARPPSSSSSGASAPVQAGAPASGKE